MSAREVLRRVMPSCEEATRIASRLLDEPVPLGQRVRLRLHLAICKWCRRYVRQIAFLRRAMGRTLDPPPWASAAVLPDEVRGRLRMILHQDSSS